MPEFTPLQLKLHIKDHHDLGVNLVSNRPVSVDRPPTVPLQDRIPRSSASIAMTTPPPTASGPPTTPSLPPISSLATAPIKSQIAALDLLFERSTELHSLVLPTLRPRQRPANPGLSAELPAPAPVSTASVPEIPFTSYTSLIHHVGSLLIALSRSSASGSEQKLHSILGAHPRLGAKKVDSALSRAEQAQLNTGAIEEAERLRALNGEYEAKFPGLRYVVFVNGRTRPAIMQDMRRRIDRGDIKQEEHEAIQAMVDIALDRFKKLGNTAIGG